MGSNPPVLRDRRGWFVTPLDWAAANGHCEVVKELIRLDGTLLRKLTSKKRIRRLEMLWDEESRGVGRAADQGRAQVAKDLLRECQYQLIAAGHNTALGFTPSRSGTAKHGSAAHFQHSSTIDRNNAFLRAGYGGWALYTAASAGDEDLAYNLLHTKPELAVGEGEYTLSDLLFAAARGRSRRIFNDIIFFASIASPQQQQLEAHAKEKLNKKKIPMLPSMFSKALLASAKAGNLEIVMCLLKGKDEKTVLSCRDSRGLTALHAAASQGHIEVTEAILKSSPMSILVQDFQGNTAMHAAACKGHILVVKLLIRFNAEVMTMRNSDGNTVLHVAVMGRTECNNLSMRGDMSAYGEEPEATAGAATCDLAAEDLDEGGLAEANIVRNMLVRELIKYRPIEGDFMNVKNCDSRTALHMAVHGSFADDKIVEALLAAPEIKLDIVDGYGLTPLDLAKSFYGARSRACARVLETAIKRMHAGHSMMGMQDVDDEVLLRRQVRLAAGNNISAMPASLHGRSVRARFPSLSQQSKDASSTSSPGLNRHRLINSAATTTPPKRRLFSHSRSCSRSRLSLDFEEETTPFNTRSPTEADEDEDENSNELVGEEDTNQETSSMASSGCTNFVWADIRQKVFTLRSPDSAKDRRSVTGKTDSSELSTSSSMTKRRGSPFVRPIIRPSITPDSLRHRHMMSNPKSLENMNITPQPLLPSPPPPAANTTPTITTTHNISTSTSSRTRLGKNIISSCLPFTSTKTNPTNNARTSSTTKPHKNLMPSCLPLPSLMKSCQGHGLQAFTKMKKWLSPSKWCSSSRKKKQVHEEERERGREREEEEEEEEDDDDDDDDDDEEEKGVEGNRYLMVGEEKKVVKMAESCLPRHPIHIYNGEKDGQLVALPLPPSHAYRLKKMPTVSSKRLYTVHPYGSDGDRAAQYYSCRRTFVYSR